LGPGRRPHAAGFNVWEVLVVLALLAIGIALLLPALNRGGHRVPRSMQNNTQLRGIHQGMFVYAQSNKSGGGDGFFPGLSSRGEALADTEGHLIEAVAFGQTNVIRGYDRNADGDVDPDEMNDPNTGEGFLRYAFAELLTGDYIPAGGSEYYLNPADTQKTQFIPGADADDGGRFDMRNVSYTTLNVAADSLAAEWKETVNTRAIVLADRAIGDGSTFGKAGSTASSVWTEEGSGEYRGGVTRNDSSTETVTTHEAIDAQLKYGDLTFEDNDLFNLFARPDGEDVERIDEETIRKDQGVLFDQDEAGRVTGI
jgi:hypothetical protein